MAYKKTADRLIAASLGANVLKRVGKANGLKVGQLRALLGIAASNVLAVRTSAKGVAYACRLSDGPGRAAVASLIVLGMVERETVLPVKFNRSALHLTDAGKAVVRRYEERERAAIRGFKGLD